MAGSWVWAQGLWAAMAVPIVGGFWKKTPCPPLPPGGRGVISDPPLTPMTRLLLSLPTLVRCSFSSASAPSGSTLAPGRPGPARAATTSRGGYGCGSSSSSLCSSSRSHAGSAGSSRPAASAAPPSRSERVHACVAGCAPPVTRTALAPVWAKVSGRRGSVLCRSTTPLRSGSRPDCPGRSVTDRSAAPGICVTGRPRVCRLMCSGTVGARPSAAMRPA